jgi:hypothetical protein
MTITRLTTLTESLSIEHLQFDSSKLLIDYLATFSAPDFRDRKMMRYVGIKIYRVAEAKQSSRFAVLPRKQPEADSLSIQLAEDGHEIRSELRFPWK